MRPVFFITTIFFLATTLVTIWFYEGDILGTAEAKIPFYKLERFADITQWAWTDYALGNSTALTTASFPFWIVLAYLQNLGLPGFIIQAILFWILLIVAGLGIYFLTKELFPEIECHNALVAVLFYWFNPISLVVVWNRFLYNHMTFFAILPATLLLTYKGMKSKNYMLALYTVLFWALFSYTFSSYAFISLLWITVIFLLIVFITAEKSLKKAVWLIKYFSLLILFFTLINFWWLTQAFSFLSSKSLSEKISIFFTAGGNLQTLTILSQKLGNIIDLLRFSHAAFYGFTKEFTQEGPTWVDAYQSPLLILFSLSLSGLIFWIIIKLRSRLEILLLGSLFISALFLAKGDNPPFGRLFQLVFVNIPFFQIFRNPFEKFGLLLPLAASPLLAMAVHTLLELFNKNFRSPIYLFIILSIFFTFGYPYWSGLVFTSVFPPADNYNVGYKVKVPPYYQEADEWLKSQGNNFRFIGFPLGEEGITYQWEKGYSGVESGEILFSTPNILFNTTIPYYSLIVERLEELLFRTNEFSRITNVLNAKYVMLRSDIDYREREMRNPQSVLVRMGNLPKFKKVNQLGKLEFWENMDWKDRTVYVGDYLINVSQQGNISAFLMDSIGDQNVFYSGISDSNLQKETISGLIFYPEKITDLQNDNRSSTNYKFILREQGRYSLLLFKRFLISLANDHEKENIKVYIDNKPLDFQEPVEDGDFVNYGDVELESGVHTVIVESSEKNLVEAPEILNLTTSQHKAMFNIENFSPFDSYLIRFDFLFKYGTAFRFAFEQSSDSVRDGQRIQKYPYFNVIQNDGYNSNFKHAQGVLTPYRSAESAALIFSSDPLISFEILIKDIKAQKISRPEVLLKQSVSSVKIKKLPQISYTKYNPSKYKIFIKGAKDPFILVLSELFNSKWEAKFSDGSIAEKHFLANFYANGWLINKSGDFEIILEFIPQKLLDVGKTISVVSFMLVGLFVIGQYFRKKRK